MILVISAQNSYASKRLLEEARIMNYELRIMDADQLAKKAFNIDISQYKGLYVRNPYLKGSPKYLPQIIKLTKKFKAAGKKVVDANIAAGELGNGKWVDYQKLMKAGLLIPKTQPLFVIARSAADEAILKKRLPRRLSDTTEAPRNDKDYVYPFILKWQYGMGAKNVFLIQNENQLNKILPLHPKKEWLVQEFIRADYEYKVVTVGYKALPVALRFKIKDLGFKLNHDDYKVIKSSSAKQIISLAQKGAKVLGRELSKIDILQKGSNFYILEVNRFPGLESFEELTKYNVIKRFLSYINKKTPGF